MYRTDSRLIAPRGSAAELRQIINSQAKKVAYMVARERNAQKQRELISSLLGLLKQSTRLV